MMNLNGTLGQYKMELAENDPWAPPSLVPGSRRDRVYGMLYGVALGDALGAPHEQQRGTPLSQYSGRLEFRLKRTRRYQRVVYGAVAQITDDSELLIALAEAIAERGAYDRIAAIEAYLAWAGSKCPFAGKNTRALFWGIKTVRGYEARWRKIETPSQSNGCLMRAAPLAALDDLAAPGLDCCLTNPAPVCVAATEAYVCAARALLRGAAPAEAAQLALACAAGDLEARAAIEAGMQQLPRVVDEKETKGWVLHALYCAFWALLSPTDTFQDAVDAVVRLGGDTDTNAAIAGGLLGARFGAHALLGEPRTGPNIAALMACDTAGTQLARPSHYSARRLDGLAEALAAIGSPGE
jgi:ADP-ribosylglycohydrolase